MSMEAGQGLDAVVEVDVAVERGECALKVRREGSSVRVPFHVERLLHQKRLGAFGHPDSHLVGSERSSNVRFSVHEEMLCRHPHNVA